MSWPIFIQTLKSYWLTIVLYGAGLFGYSMLLASMYTMVGNLGDIYADLIEQMPEGMMKAFGAEEFVSGGLTFESFLSMEHLGLFWVIIVGAFIIGFASRALAGEVEQGTVALVLSQPVTRTKMFLSKLFVGILGIIVLVFASIGGFLVQAARSDIATAPIEGYVLFIFVAILFFVGLLTVSMLFSTWVNERGRAILFGMLFLVASYAADLFARLKENWENLSYISLFHYYGKPDEILTTASFDDLNLLVLVGFIVVTVVLGIISWNRRDFSV